MAILAARLRAKEQTAPVRAPWWERHLGWILIAPSIAMFVAFAFIPSITAVLYALSRVKFTARGIKRTYIGLDNFRRAWDDDLVHQAAVTTLKWTVGVTVAEVLLGFALALLMTQNVRGRAILSTLLMIPIIMPPVSVAVAWFFIYEPNFGVLNYLLSLVGISRIEWLSNPGLALYSMMVVDVWQATPFVFLLLYAGLLALPRDPYEAAAIDGAGRWHVFRTVTLPLVSPILLVVVLLRIIDAARIFDKLFVMTHGGPGTTAYSFTLNIYVQGFANLDFGYASALSFIFQITLVILATVYVKRVMADYSAPQE
jgi:multiple sugar transport system permease protein